MPSPKPPWPVSATATRGLTLFLSAFWALGWLTVPPAGSHLAWADTVTEVLSFEEGTAITVTRPGVNSWLVMDPAIVQVTRSGANELTLAGQHVGRTLLHVWHPGGRETWRVTVTFHRALLPPGWIEEVEAREQGRFRPLHVDYQVSYDYIRTGPRWSQTNQATTTHTIEHLALAADSPYGRLSNQWEWQRFDTHHQLALWQMALHDGRIGPWHNFDVVGGDMMAAFSPLTYPSGRLRGVYWRQRNVVSDWMLEGLWGQQSRGSNFFGTVLPQFTELREAYLTGFNLRGERLSRLPVSWRTSFLRGYGAARNNASESPWASDLELKTSWWQTWEARTIAGVSDGEVAYRASFGNRAEPWDWRVEWRDIEPQYLTVTGPVSQRGERGLALTSAYHPSAMLSWAGGVDFYRDRLFPNLAEPEELNMDWRTGTSWTLPTRTGWTTDAARLYHPGEAFPQDDFTLGTLLRQPFTFVRPMTVYTGYRYRSNRTVNTPSLSYRSHTLSAGWSVTLTPHLEGSFTYDVSRLNEAGSDDIQYPLRTMTSLAYHRAFQWVGPWTVSGRVAYEDESDAQAVRSFLAGQDRLLIESAVTFQPVEGMEWFAEGGWEWLNPEARTTTKQQVSLELMAGMRHQFDTPWRWEPRIVVEGAIFHDINGDGVRQAEEPGVPNVAVQVGERETRTDQTGQFHLRRRASGRLLVSVDAATLPTGYIATTALPVVIETLEPQRQTLLVGVTLRTTVRGRLFEDVDGSGTFTAADHPLGHVRLWLDEVAPTKTDGTGWFFFHDVPAGIHVVTLDVQSLPLIYLPTTEVVQGIATNESDRTAEVEFPVASQGAILGIVYLDANRNGQQDPEELGVEGIVLMLDGQAVATTQIGGHYHIARISPGVHQLRLHPEQFLDLQPVETTPLRVEITVEQPHARVNLGVASPFAEAEGE